MTQLKGRIDNESSNGELETYMHFLVDSEIENGRHRVFNFTMEFLDAHNLSRKLDTVFQKLKSAAKLKITFGFVLKILENGTCRRYHARENNFLMGRSRLCGNQRRFGETEKYAE